MSTPPSVQQPIGQAFDRQAELAVVGGILLDNDALLEALLIVEASDFYDTDTQTIFKACCELSEDGSGIDFITLATQLKKHTGANWVSTLIDASDSTPTSAHTKDYAQIVKRYSLARTAHNTAYDIGKGMAKVIAEGATLEDAQELMATASRVIMEAESTLTQTGPRHISLIIGDTIKHIDSAQSTPDGVTGVPTRIPSLNTLTGGFHGSQLTVIGARPGIGKSAIALDIAIHAAERGTSILFQSLEMSEQDLGLRAIGQMAKVSIKDLQRGMVRKDQWPAIWDANNKLATLAIHIDDTAGLSFSQFRAQAVMYKRQHDIGIVFIDYLQLLKGSDESRLRSRELEISEIARGMKELSKEIDTPVVALVQLNREVDKRSDKRPILSDLRESGEIEQAADNVIFLYPQLQKGETFTSDVGLILAKQRNGPTGEVDLTLEREYATFKEREIPNNWSDF